MSREAYPLRTSYLSSSTSGSSSGATSPRTLTDDTICDIESLSSDGSTIAPKKSFGGPAHYYHHHKPASYYAYSTTSAYHDPSQSRSGSPSQYFNSEDDQPFQPLLRNASGRSTPVVSSPRRKRFGNELGRRARRRHLQVSLKMRIFTAFVRHPLFPSSPSSIFLTIAAIFLTALATTLFLMRVLNPDKNALPWRSYCALSPQFSAAELSKLPPVGIFIGVMSVESAVERRMLIRSTWAKHPRSRGSNGGTDRTIVRFILGAPSADWMRRIQLESETYKDIVLLPSSEDTNSGRTHAFVQWAHTNAFVPPPDPSSNQSYSAKHPSPYDWQYSHKRAAIPLSGTLFPSFDDGRRPAPLPPAPHDPRTANTSTEWVRPQFFVKAEDDSFVMLTELEARLRLEWYEALSDVTNEAGTAGSSGHREALPKTKLPMTSSAVQLPQRSTTWIAAEAQSTSSVTAFGYDSYKSQGGKKSIDPMIYWGYLVKARFMAGELYALSSSLVDYIATDPVVASTVQGKEDQLTARWLRIHPRASDVRWRSERCWIYDHPRAGTVYSHGFLFPSEVARIRHETTHGSSPAEIHLLPMSTSSADPSLTHSTVSKFGYPYKAPSSNLTTDQEVEALIEGSPLSRLRDETLGGCSGEASAQEVASAWRRRETREQRMGGASLGGTIVVHFIKRNEWFLETAIAFLHDDPKDESAPAHGSSTTSEPSPVAGDSDGMRAETDLNNKVPIDLSNLDPPPGLGPSRTETDLSNHTPIDLSHLDDYVAPNPPPSTPQPGRIASDLQHKTPIDLSHLDPIDSPVSEPLEDSEQPVISDDNVMSPFGTEIIRQ
ncbi:uncharacterized protein EI90DRAFT_3030431 [Cantharellus anzutake]|uniref:uncharacterized protein n=1 Tax=Cantharellus anzutake TaxID=1750568 RepID=UPI001903F540|nr:uncharacterized protein EI90DRAFT_3030431 [Cantharellus anzutake]KAF8342849.1 hypothetical protein EI90DRAFT_3030431 [Cantharellus anzutake]